MLAGLASLEEHVGPVGGVRLFLAEMRMLEGWRSLLQQVVHDIPGRAVATASVLGDGNCLWRAAAYSLSRVGKRIHWKALKRNVIHRLSEWAPQNSGAGACCSTCRATSLGR